MSFQDGAARRLLSRLDPRGLALIALSGLAFSDGARLSHVMARKINIDAVGPHGYLDLLGALMLVLGVLLLVQGARERLAPAIDAVPWRELLAVFGLFIAYVVGVDVVGFTSASFAFLLLVTRLLSLRSWLWCGIFSAATTAGLYVAFVQLSDMALPRGVWGA